MVYVGWNALTSMPILLGHCQEVGHVDRLEIAVPDHTVQTGNCPLCGQVQTCDVHWREDVFNPYDLDLIRNQEDMSAYHNVYPGGTPGRFHHHLVIFVDHPDFTFEGLEDLLRRRIRQHNNWDTRTLSIRFVSLTKRSMIAKMGTKHFRPMVERWRWLEPTFAPIIQFRTMSFSWRTRIL